MIGHRTYYFSPNTSKVKYHALAFLWIKNFSWTQTFIWETTLVKRRIPDQSTEPYPNTKTENRLGTQRFCSRPFRYICMCLVMHYLDTFCCYLKKSYRLFFSNVLLEKKSSGFAWPCNSIQHFQLLNPSKKLKCNIEWISL